MNSIALLTPTYWRDFELCAALCESIDRFVTSFTRHYLVVADDEVPRFSRFAGERRQVLPISELLPSWLKPLPQFVRLKDRRWWWSLRAKPVSGWHTQQFAKIAAVRDLPEDRYCMIDSDVMFFRPCDLGRFARPNQLPLFHSPRAIGAEGSMHAGWIRSSHRLLGLGDPSFPADDFIGHVIVWDQTAVRAMTARIEAASGVEWTEALARARNFSEYMLYGYFVRSDPALMAQHRYATTEQCVSYWDEQPLSTHDIESMLRVAHESQVAFSATAFSGTPLEVIRSALSKFSGSSIHVV